MGNSRSTGAGRGYRVGKGSLTGHWKPRRGACPNIRGGRAFRSPSDPWVVQYCRCGRTLASTKPGAHPRQPIARITRRRNESHHERCAACINTIANACGCR